MKPNDFSLFLLVMIFCTFSHYVTAQNELEYIGVFQGKTLFVQNPYLAESKQFCIEKITVNGIMQELQYNHSALKLDFVQNDMFTPVRIKITSRDSICNPIIINPDAITFHSSFRFDQVSLTDTLLYWKTKGERGVGSFVVEKLFQAIWIEEGTETAMGKYEEAEYGHYPVFEEGANKYRIKYNFESGKYLYSEEVEYNFYSEPVDFSPKSTKSVISFSRSANYRIFDANGTEVLSGIGTQVDVSGLYSGDYTIYFDEIYPGSFTKIRN